MRFGLILFTVIFLHCSINNAIGQQSPPCPKELQFTINNNGNLLYAYSLYECKKVEGNCQNVDEPGLGIWPSVAKTGCDGTPDGDDCNCRTEIQAVEIIGDGLKDYLIATDATVMFSGVKQEFKYVSVGTDHYIVIKVADAGGNIKRAAFKLGSAPSTPVTIFAGYELPPSTIETGSRTNKFVEYNSEKYKVFGF